MSIINDLASMKTTEEYVKYNYFKYQYFIENEYYAPSIKSQKNFKIMAIFVLNYFKVYHIQLPEDDNVRLYSDQKRGNSNYLGKAYSEKLSFTFDREKVDFIFFDDETIHCRLYERVKGVYSDRSSVWHLERDYEVINFENSKYIFNILKSELGKAS